MKIYNHSKGSIFLLEIIINLIIFSALVIISLQFIIKAHTLTSETTRLHYGITQCSNVASLFEKSNGDISSLQEFFPYSTCYENNLQIYYNEDFMECSKEDSVYVIYANHDKEAPSYLPKIHITMKYMDTEICTLDAATHIPFTTSTKEVP